MRLWLAAVGRLRAGSVKAVFDDYIDRLAGLPLGAPTLREVEPRKPAPLPRLRRIEADLLLTAVPPAATVVALDERGRDLSSADFAARLATWRDGGVRDLAFLIGGPDGLDDSIRDKADLLLAFGRMTWPHLLAPLLLAEQLYRAQTILAGHPYHRG